MIIEINTDKIPDEFLFLCFKLKNKNGIQGALYALWFTVKPYANSQKVSEHFALCKVNT